MSESSSEPEQSSQSTQSTQSGKPDRGLVSDDQLPEDLQPDKNPLAGEPDENAEMTPPGADPS